MQISVENIRKRYFPRRGNPASYKQKEFLENLVGFNGVLRNSRDYSTYWELNDISNITAKEAYDLSDFLKKRDYASFFRDLYLQMPTGMIDTDKFKYKKSSLYFDFYMKNGVLPMMFYYLRVSTIH